MKTTSLLQPTRSLRKRLFATTAAILLASAPGLRAQPRSPQAGASAGEEIPAGMIRFKDAEVEQVLAVYQELAGRTIIRPPSLPHHHVSLRNENEATRQEAMRLIEDGLREASVVIVPTGEKFAYAVQPEWTNALPRFDRQAALAKVVSLSSPHPPMPPLPYSVAKDAQDLVKSYAAYTGREPLSFGELPLFRFNVRVQTPLDRAEFIFLFEALAHVNSAALELVGTNQFRLVPAPRAKPVRIPGVNAR